MSETPKTGFKASILFRALALMKPYKKAFYACISLVVLLAIIAPIRPFLVSITVDKYILNNNMQGLINMTLIMVGLLLLESVFRYFFTYLSSWLAQAAIKDLRHKVFAHLSAMRLRFFDKSAVGTLSTRTVSDIEVISEIFSQGFLTIVGDLLQIVAILAFMLYQDWKITLISLSVMPLLVIATMIFKEAVKKSFQEVRKQVARLNAYLQEQLTGMNIVQIFNKEKSSYKEFVKINRELNDANLRSVMAYSVFFPVVEIITAASLGLLVWWGANQALHFDIDFSGKIIAFILYLSMFYRPIRMLADKFNSLQLGMVASERVFKVLDTVEVIEDKGILTPEIKGKIVFNQVWFAYNPEQYVLKDVSFEVPAGKTIALVGATGAGKSSIINILSRFYEFQKGEIFIDDVNIRDIQLQHLNQKVGIILQDVFLFSGSILDNITLKNNSITRETVEKIAKDTGIDKFILKLPGGFDYNVMERGYSLSAGQRQLIAFLRAMVYPTPILILDEATSSIDSETEEIIKEATLRLVKNRSSILIAHRLSTIQNADTILVVDQGKIVESGNHQELLEMNGFYRNLYEMQFKMLNLQE